MTTNTNITNEGNINAPVSLCIPRVNINIKEPQVRKIFDELKIGIIDRIDIVKKTTGRGDKYNRVFIHFKKWNNNENANTAYELLMNGKEIKIMYDEPWFWKASLKRISTTTTTTTT